MRRLVAVNALLLVLTPAISAGEVQPTDSPFLWMIGEEPPSFLYGTIHLPDERVLALPDVVLAAFDAADAVYTEIPMDPATQMSAATMIMLEGDQTLADLLPAPLYARCDSFLGTRGYSMAMLSKIKVWALAAQLGLLDYIQQFSTGQVLDVYLYARAGEEGKELGGLETVESQVVAMDGIALEDQIALLADGIDDIADAEARGTHPVEELLELIDSRPKGVELVITGRGADPRVIDRADLVTEMREIKHYYSNGVTARTGIEQ